MLVNRFQLKYKQKLYGITNEKKKYIYIVLMAIKPKLQISTDLLEPKFSDTLGIEHPWDQYYSISAGS